MQILQEENEMSGKYDVIVIGAGPGGSKQQNSDLRRPL